MRNNSGLFSMIVLSVVVLMTLVLVGCSEQEVKKEMTVIPSTPTAPSTPSTPTTPTTPTTPATPASVCGNNKLEAKEQCDGSVPATVSCQTKGFDKGVITCKNDCTLDTSACAMDVKVETGCTDTDGGLNYTVKGIVTVVKDGSSTTYTDYCRHGSAEGQVLEYSCGEAGVVTNSYKCVKGCNNNGACYP